MLLAQPESATRRVWHFWDELKHAGRLDILPSIATFGRGAGNRLVLGLQDIDGLRHVYARVFFQRHGERQVPVSSLSSSLTWDEEVISNVRPATHEELERLWLAIEAEQLPLLDNAATLTAAKVDLLPHQIVLTYRVANASPRRFLIADSVGLGKTIELCSSCESLPLAVNSGGH